MVGKFIHPAINKTMIAQSVNQQLPTSEPGPLPKCDDETFDPVHSRHSPIHSHHTKSGIPICPHPNYQKTLIAIVICG